jgi:hypothetical protein
MAYYDKQKMFEQAKELVTKHRLFFIEDIVSLLPITKATFYDYFKIGSDELNELKALLDEVKTELKISMRSKWYKSDAPALQMALMKLISNPEELNKLSMNYTKVEEVKVGTDLEDETYS